MGIIICTLEARLVIMFSLDLLSQIYLLSLGAGGGFLIATVAMGNMDSDGGDASGVDADVDVHMHTDVHADADVDVHADAHADADVHADHGDHHDGDTDNDIDRYGLLPGGEQIREKILRFALSLLSPMSISMFFFGFGMTGFILKYMFPIFGIFTLVPAVIGGLAVVNLFKSALKMMMRFFTSSSHAKTSDLVGQIADVQISMTGDRPGEITYVVASKLYTSAARPSKSGLEIKRGTRVLIVDADGPTFFVEPFSDAVLEEEFSLS